MRPELPAKGKAMIRKFTFITAVLMLLISAFPPNSGANNWDEFYETRGWSTQQYLHG